MRFQSTLPARGATLPFIGSSCTGRFQSTLPARGATGGGVLLVSLEIFQSTLPARGATVAPGKVIVGNAFQSTLPARGATVLRVLHKRLFCRFQSTLPARGATIAARKYQRTTDFNPRSPHGERHGGSRLREGKENISIHAPRTGSDISPLSFTKYLLSFQSTLPARGATTPTTSGTPFGWRFQSTLPARGATLNLFPKATAIRFQSTLPARGATSGWRGYACAISYFNPRSPHGERQSSVPRQSAQHRISIHAPRTGSDDAAGAQGTR